MYILLLAVVLTLSGCVANKPITPSEVQAITHVFAERVVAKKLSVEHKQKIVAGIHAAKAALESTPPGDLLDSLKSFFDPEDQDIAELIVVLIRERVDVTALPELDGKAYVWAVLEGIRGGLE